MKTPRFTSRPLALALALALILPASAAVPLRWTVETSRVQPSVFDVVRGETIELEATFNSYGTPVATTNQTAFLCWQTNGMDSAWWVTNATTLAANRARAVFTPEMDPGAATLTGFIGLSSSAGSSPNLSSLSYRAAFTLRFRKGPGAVPNALPMPPKTIDWATVANANADAAPFAVDRQVTNVAEHAVAEYDATNITARIAAKQDKIADYATTNAVREIAASASVTNAGAVAAAKADAEGRFLEGHYDQDIGANVISNNFLAVKTNGDFIEMSTEDHCGYIMSGNFISGDYTVASFSEDNDSMMFTTHRGDDFGGCILDIPMSGLDYVMTYITIRDWYPVITNAYTKTESDAALAAKADATSVSTIQSQVSAIGAHLNAEDAHFVSTNYDSVVHMPEAYVEIKMTSGESNAWITIWREMTRWNRFVGTNFNWEAWGDFKTWSDGVTDEIGAKADRAWGAYDSETGEYSPEGYTQISSSNILIAANMSYKRKVTTGGAVWILQCNSGTAHIGGDTNGFFRIQDGDGVTQFEIVKGNKQELGADASGITVSNATTPQTLTIPYSIVAPDHPTIQVCTDLALADWKAEDSAQCAATVSWSGSSGAYVATVRAKAASATQLFVKATYMTESETIIRNNAPVGMDSIILNGTKYYLGTNTISGKLVLTLSTTNPNP